MEALGDILSLELKLFGVRVLTIQPGVFTSAIWAKADPSLASDAPSSDVPTIATSTIYTDPETQGYNVVRFLLENARKSGQIGDPEKYAHRVYELVTKTGLAQDVVAQPGANGRWDGPWEFTRVPLGSDCLALAKKRCEVIGRNLEAFESIAPSTDVDKDRLDV